MHSPGDCDNGECSNKINIIVLGTKLRNKEIKRKAKRKAKMVTDETKSGWMNERMYTSTGNKNQS